LYFEEPSFTQTITVNLRKKSKSKLYKFFELISDERPHQTRRLINLVSLPQLKPMGVEIINY